MTKEKNYYNREYRKDSFCDWAWRRCLRGEAWFTSHQIAKAWKMKPSSHVRLMLAELIDEGILIAKNEVHRVDKKGEVLAYKRLYRMTHEVEEKYNEQVGLRKLL